MALRLSHSQCSKYTQCPKSYEYHYVKRIRSRVSPASLLFGSALDTALNELLIPIRGVVPEEIFLENFTKAMINGETVSLPRNTNLVYSNSDLDLDLISISKEDEARLNTLVLAKKKFGLSHFTREDHEFFNECNWMSLRAKGLLMLKAYREKVMPMFEEVLAVQVPIELSNGNDSITGFVDVIARVKGHGIVILDNKTSSITYEDDSVITSPQLSLYMHALYNKWNTRKAGYIVLRKQIEKNKVKICSKCGYDGTGQRHSTCSNKVDGKRCKGEWNETITPEVEIQIIIDEIPERTEDIVLENYDSVCQSIKTGNFPRNLQACNNIYGGPCVYKGLCYKDSKKDLIEV